MFEHCTERARRTLFFVPCEVSEIGGSALETEHVLLGLLREVKGVTSEVFAAAGLSYGVALNEICQQTAGREKLAPSVEVPFSSELQHILETASKEATSLGHNYVGAEHFLLGLLANERTMAARLLIERASAPTPLAPR